MALRTFAWLGLVVPSTIAQAQQAILHEEFASPSLARVAAAAGRGDTGALRRFWRNVERAGTPLREADSLHPGHTLVTFLYRATAGVSQVDLESNITSIDPEAEATSTTRLPLRRLTGTDIFYLTTRLRNDIRAPYLLAVAHPGSDVETIADPLNPSTWEPEYPDLRASILELPGARPEPWRDEGNAGDARGAWDEVTLIDGQGARHDVAIYRPVGWHADDAKRYPALVALGAFGTRIGMRVDRMVDHLIATGALPPVVLLLVDVAEASAAQRYEPTDAFVADVLLPYAREHYQVSPDPRDIAASGTSRRGMVAALLAFRRSDVVGNVISLSGSYYWKPANAVEWEWVPRLYAETERRPVRLYVAAGLLETFVNRGNHGHYMVGTNRHFRDVLRARGYDLSYVEFNGVHSELSWQDWLADGLVRIFGTRSR